MIFSNYFFTEHLNKEIVFQSSFMRLTPQHPIACVYLSGVAVTQVERRHEVGVILLHAGGPLRQLGDLGMMETDSVKNIPLQTLLMHIPD